ncbi:MAG: YdeI/OmpD-associated family protein [Patescibacteria group bacterium]
MEDIKSFTTQKAFETWLDKNHTKAPALFIRIFKKASGKKTITYAEALDVCLCYGWIDSVKKSYDAESYLQRFGPRRAKGLWSKVNREHIARLIKENRMKPEGLAQVEAAQKDGRWDAAYDSPKNTVLPEDFLNEIKKDAKTYEFFLTLNKTNTYAIAFRLSTAKKPETRAKRMAAILEMLKEGKKFY